MNPPLTTPPPRRFHGAQTITLSVTLGLATLYYTWRQPPRPVSLPPTPAKGQQQQQQQQQQQLQQQQQQQQQTLEARHHQQQSQQDSLNTALFTGTIYWLAGLAAILYPGTDGIDPEFGPSGFPQARIFLGFAGAAVAGWVVERFLVIN